MPRFQSRLPYQVTSFGSIVIVKPNNQTAARVLRDVVGTEVTWWGGGLVVEPRYLDGLMEILAERWGA